MRFLELLAEETIQRAIARGDFDNLSGRGKPIPEEVGMDLVAPELRTAYRILKNAGCVPEEVRLRREIGDVAELLRMAARDSAAEASARARLQHLLRSLGESRSGHLMTAERYIARITELLSRCSGKQDPKTGRTNGSDK